MYKIKIDTRLVATFWYRLVTTHSSLCAKKGIISNFRYNIYESFICSIDFENPFFKFFLSILGSSDISKEDSDVFKKHTETLN